MYDREPSEKTIERVVRERDLLAIGFPVRRRHIPRSRDKTAQNSRRAFNEPEAGGNPVSIGNRLDVFIDRAQRKIPHFFSFFSTDIRDLRELCLNAPGSID